MGVCTHTHLGLPHLATKEYQGLDLPYCRKQTINLTKYMEQRLSDFGQQRTQDSDHRKKETK